jgi:Amt family ammonium transporter
MVAGLVAITPASGFVTPMASILIGLAAGAVCYLAVTIMKSVLRLDDSLDAFGVHGIGGMLGAVATGLFATVAVNAGGATGLFADDAGDLALNLAGAHQALVQLVAVGAVIAYTFVVTWGVLWATDRLVGLRVPEAHEDAGLDLAEHGEVAYHYLDAPAAPHVHAGDAVALLDTMPKP